MAKLLDSAGTKEEKGYTALHLAVQVGNGDLVRQLLALPTCDPAAKDVDGLTALHWAASKGVYHIVGTSLCQVMPCIIIVFLCTRVEQAGLQLAINCNDDVLSNCTLATCPLQPPCTVLLVPVYADMRIVRHALANCAPLARVSLVFAAQYRMQQQLVVCVSLLLHAHICDLLSRLLCMKLLGQHDTAMLL